MVSVSAIHPHYKFQHAIKGIVSGNFNLLKYQNRLNLIIKWNTLWYMKEAAPSTRYAKGNRDKELGGLSTVRWETKMAKLQEVCSQKLSGIQYWLIPGQMKITHGLLQRELICPYWGSNPFPNRSVSSSLYTHQKQTNNNNKNYNRTFLPLFNCTPVLFLLPPQSS